MKELTLGICVGVSSLLLGCTESGTLRLEGKVETVQAELQSEEDELRLGDGTLIVTSARIRVSEIEFEGGADDELEAELGGATIALALDGGPTTIAADEVEAGTYHTLGLELRGGAEGLVVEGSYQGASFTFQSGISPELEFPLNPKVTVPANGEATAQVTFDVAAWFVDANGNVIDPANADNQALIEQRILTSMAAHAAIEQEDDEDDDD